MKKDLAYTMDCPFVARKCRADKCIGWLKIDDNEGTCVLLTDKPMSILEYKEKESKSNK
jgi:hypothetical protein